MIRGVIVLRWQCHSKVIRSHGPAGRIDVGDPNMKIRSEHDHDPGLLSHLTLLTAATIVLLFFAWTYVH